MKKCVCVGWGPQPPPVDLFNSLSLILRINKSWTGWRGSPGACEANLDPYWTLSHSKRDSYLQGFGREHSPWLHFFFQILCNPSAEKTGRRQAVWWPTGPQGIEAGSWLICLILNQKHMEKTLLLKYQERERSSRIHSCCLWDLLAPAWQVCQAQTESRWNWNQTRLPITVTFTAFQLSHQSVRHNASPCLGV